MLDLSRYNVKGETRFGSRNLKPPTKSVGLAAQWLRLGSFDLVISKSRVCRARTSGLLTNSTQTEKSSVSCRIPLSDYACVQRTFRNPHPGLDLTLYFSKSPLCSPFFRSLFIVGRFATRGPLLGSGLAPLPGNVLPLSYSRAKLPWMREKNRKAADTCRLHGSPHHPPLSGFFGESFRRVS